MTTGASMAQRQNHVLASVSTETAAGTEVGAKGSSLPVRWWELFALLVGHRRSILRLTNARGGLALGALLVLTAAFAREHDAVSLRHEPKDLLAPFAASLALATFLFFLIQFARRLQGLAEQQSWNQTPLRRRTDYASFLTGYWMTAPLAWVYAIPIESMTNELNAIKFNLMLLSIVSLWRVVLFSRIVAVRFRLPFWISLVWISLPSAVVAFVGLSFASLALAEVMGGLRLTETERVVSVYQDQVLRLLFRGIPVLFVAWVVSVVFLGRGWFWGRRREFATTTSNHRPAIKGTVWAVPLLALTVLGFGLYHFQPPLHRAERVDRLLIGGNVGAAIDLMEQHDPEDFPASWNPPPRMRHSMSPSIEELVSTLRERRSAHWIKQRLLHRAPEILLRQTGHYGRWDSHRLSNERSHDEREDLQVIQKLLSQLEELHALDREDGARLHELQRAVEHALEEKESSTSTDELWIGRG